jgi:hypothetical protein
MHLPVWWPREAAEHFSDRVRGLGPLDPADLGRQELVQFPLALRRLSLRVLHPTTLTGKRWRRALVALAEAGHELEEAGRRWNSAAGYDLKDLKDSSTLKDFPR